jgi:chromosome segregation ATPase
VKDFEISQLKQKETTAQEQIKRLEETNRSLLEQINKMRRESKDEELARALMEVAIFKDQIKQLESQEKTKQEEIARYRAQVASLSAELAVERQMVDEAREQLAFARASQQQQQQQQKQQQMMMS